MASLFLTLGVVVWISTTEMTQTLQQGRGQLPYNKPYLTVWVFHSMYVLFLPVCAIWKAIEAYRTSKPINELVDPQLIKRRFRLALYMNSLMLVAPWLFLWGLSRTNVGASISIMNSMCAFVYVMECLILREPASIGKLASVIISIVGIILIGLSSDASDHITGGGSSILGYISVTLCAISSSLYMVLCKKHLDSNLNSGEESSAAASKGRWGPLFDSLLFLGFSGVVTFSVFWIGIPFMHIFGIEPFEMPPGYAFNSIILNGFFDVIMSASVILTVMLTSPLFNSIGTLLSIPLALIVDSAIGRSQPNSSVIAGTKFRRDFGERDKPQEQFWSS
eukprot:TRINITY_DN379_c0_g3_i2.p1 TRINITY_DN379_c0_g3~~TRINITY_DN379_c0_g3_i2.p1  ORF type:complete len:367 (+),score=67.46 TRINITY_DN379_c0_g3_i2:99-1103(+)